MEKVHKGGTKLTVVEFAVREIDEDGECIDVNHYETQAEAIKVAKELAKSVTAVVVEKHTSRYPAFLFDEPDTYKTVFKTGDEAALESGGW